MRRYPAHELAAERLQIWRGERCLCRALSFSLRSGEALHVQGANGAGKTTLLRVLAGLGRADGGEIRWNGQPLGALGAEYRTALDYLGHAGGLKLALTPEENLHAALALDEQPPLLEAAAALERAGIASRRDALCGTLSMGQRRRVALARLLCRGAPLWFLDEPLTCLDAAGTRMLSDIVTEHLQAGGLAVFASHQTLALPGLTVKSLLLGAPP